MSLKARQFGEGYRSGPLKVKDTFGVESLIPGQHEAIWADDDRKAIELSYVHQLAHAFIVVMLDSDTLHPMKYLEAGVFGIKEREGAPPGFRLTEAMDAVVARLKTSDIAAA